jgi:hypothetical protein
MKSALTSAAAAILLAVASSQATADPIVNIDAKDPFGTTLTLDAGDYAFSYVGKSDGGAYDAWSAWAPGGDCGSGPGSCPTGYINELRIEGLGADPLFIGDHFVTIWSTAAEALDAAKLNYSPFWLTLVTTTSLRFLVGEGVGFAQTGVDGPVWQDNSGGLSLTVQAVPEPSTLALLLLAGVSALAGAARRRRAI